MPAKVRRLPAPSSASTAEPYRVPSCSRPRRRSGPSTPRRSRTPKYFHEGQPIDGRSARAHPAFAAVKVDGRIDDAKARDRGMLNPHWVAEQRKGVLEALGIKSAEAYAKKHRFDLPDVA